MRISAIAVFASISACSAFTLNKAPRLAATSLNMAVGEGDRRTFITEVRKILWRVMSRRDAFIALSVQGDVVELL